MGASCHRGEKRHSVVASYLCIKPFQIFYVPSVDEDPDIQFSFWIEHHIPEIPAVLFFKDKKRILYFYVLKLQGYFMVFCDFPQVRKKLYDHQSISPSSFSFSFPGCPSSVYPLFL